MMKPIEIIESADLNGVTLRVAENGDLCFSAPVAWFEQHKDDLAKHREVIVLLLKFKRSSRPEMGKILPFRRKQDGQVQTETQAEIAE